MLEHFFTPSWPMWPGWIQIINTNFTRPIIKNTDTSSKTAQHFDFGVIRVNPSTVGHEMERKHGEGATSARASKTCPALILIERRRGSGSTSKMETKIQKRVGLI